MESTRRVSTRTQRTTRSEHPGLSRQCSRCMLFCAPSATTSCMLHACMYVFCSSCSGVLFWRPIMPVTASEYRVMGRGSVKAGAPTLCPCATCVSLRTGLFGITIAPPSGFAVAAPAPARPSPAALIVCTVTDIAHLRGLLLQHQHQQDRLLQR